MTLSGDDIETSDFFEHVKVVIENKEYVPEICGDFVG